VSDELDPEETEGLLSRLSLIEDQALDTRAAAYALVHDELSSMLEGADRAGR
jgi:hypothetical protein